MKLVKAGRIFATPAILATAFALSTCATPVTPMHGLQFCLSDEEDVNAFTGLLRTIAIEEGMDYLDGSRYVKGFVNNPLFSVPRDKTDASLRFYVGIERPGELGLSATNAFFYELQVDVGFWYRNSETSEADAMGFAKRVEDALRSHWEIVQVIPGGQASGQLDACAPTSGGL